MKHKILTFILALLTVGSAWAYDFKFNGLCYSILSSTEVEVTYEQYPYSDTNNSYPLLSGDLNIPATVNYNEKTYNVIRIGDMSFVSCDNLISITLPASVSDIGNYAITNCHSLQNITIQSPTPPSINSSTFENIAPSVHITIPEENRDAYMSDPKWKLLLEMASGQISGNINYRVTWTLNFADSTLTISGNGSMGTYIDFNDSWKFFSTAIATVIIEDGITEIAQSAFYDHINLKNIIIPNSVTSIGCNAFHNTSIYVNENNWEDGMLYISNCLIKAKEDLTGNCEIKAGTRIIGSCAFDNCSNITSISIPNSVTEMGEEIVRDCSSLTEINLSTTNPPTISSYTFMNISPTITFTIPEESRDAYMSNPNWKSLLEMTSGQISGTFGFNDNLTWTLTFADSTLTISGYDSMDSFLDHDQTWYSYQSSISTVIIEEGVTSIAYYAFLNHNNLRSVTIPNSVTFICSQAFNNTALYNNENNWTNGILYINNCLIAAKQELTGECAIATGTRIIGSSAFENCSELTSITIPNSIVEMGYNIFDGCYALTEITILPTNPPTIYPSTFGNINPSNITITLPEGYRNAYMAVPEWKLLLEMSSGEITGTAGNNLTWTLNFVDSLLTISGNGDMDIDYSNYWGNYDSFIAHIVIGEEVTSISSEVFYGTEFYNNENNWTDDVLYIDNCLITTKESLINNYEIKSGTRLIADRAFWNCPSLSAITIGKDVKYIGKSAFYSCESLNRVYYSGTITDWCSIRFKEETSNPLHLAHLLYVNDQPVTELTIPEGVTNIYKYAFTGCTSITALTIPNSVEEIGEDAFANCSELIEINVLATTPPFIYYSTFNNIGSSVTLNIPENSRDDYMANTYWRHLLEISSGEASGTIGDNLTWTLTFADSTLTISGNGDMIYVDYDEAWKEYSSYINNIIIEEGVTGISNDAFKYHYNLKEITIPNSVTRIGTGALHSTAIYENESNWTNGVLYIDNCLIETNGYIEGEYEIIPGTRIIANRAFDYQNITIINIPSSVIAIGEDAFGTCYALREINVHAITPPIIFPSTFNIVQLPFTLTTPEGSRENYISDPNWKALFDLTSNELNGTIGNLTWTLTIADSTLTISGTGEMDYLSNENSWKNFSSNIAKVIIEEGVTSITSYAFNNHINLKTISIPNSVTKIGYGTLNGTAIYNNEICWTNDALYIDNCLIKAKNIYGHHEIMEGTRLIANGAFESCYNTTTITIPNSVIYIGEQAFYNCLQLTQVTISSAATYIGSEAFAGCSLSAIIVLATTPPTITPSTFSGLTPAATITVPESSRDAYLEDPNWKNLLDMASGEISGTIGDNQNLTWTLTFADSTLTISGTGEMGYIYYNWPWDAYKNYIAKVVIEEGVTNIADGAFYSHSNLREVTIPNSVTNIDNNAFNETALYNNENNWINGGLYIDNCLIATSEWQMGETGHFTVVDGTRLIADEAFSYNSSLTGVTIPNSVNHIGDYILRGCENLSSIYVLATTPPVITSSTFGEVNTGIQVTIPEGSTTLYEADPLWNSFLQFCSGILNGYCGANLTWTLTLADNTLTISGSGEMDNYLWGSNPLPWEQYRSYINTVNIAEGVTSISGGAFMSCYNLTDINIPNSVNKIGESAFMNTQLYNDDSNWSNGALYIDNCLIATNSEAIGDYAIAEGTRIVADGAFNSYYEYDLLTGISLPNSVTHIGKNAFYNRNITKVTIGSGTQSIGEDAFGWCENLSEINVAAATPPVIAANTFQYISTDLQITVPAGSESLYLADPNWKRLFDIASGVVEGACGDHLTWVLNLADSTLTISGYGDMYNYDIWSDDNYIPMPWEEFIDNIKRVILPDGITSVGDFAFTNESGNLTSINLPEGIRRIGKYAFAGNSLTSVSIPASVEKIDTAAFALSYELQAYHVATDNQYYTAENGVLFNKDKSTLIVYPLKKQDTQYNVPSSVNIIDYGAFWWCEVLTKIILPEGLTRISPEAFSYCTNLAEINIPNSVNYIGEYAFDGTVIYEDESNWTEGVLYWDNCLIATDYYIPESYTIPNGTRLITGGTFNTSELMEITIPASVISIGGESFKWCNNLREITVLAQIPPVLGANVFEEVNRNIPLYVPAGSLESYREAAIWNEFQLQAMQSTNLQATTANSFDSLAISNGTLHNPKGLPISIFDMQGRLIYNGTGSIVNMATGIYIVRIENSAKKVFIP